MHQPYHAYHQTFTFKLFLQGKQHANPLLMPEDVVAILRRIQNLARGIPAICYLVGWQYQGHDSKYPAWHEVNPLWKRSQDKTALDSYRWVFDEAKKLNTTLSVHVNMCDAYEDSPLWDTYVQEDLLIRERDGSLKKGGVWGGQQSYLVCKRREWDTGWAKKRIDQLLELLHLRKAGTVHIDVFQPDVSPYHGVTLDDDVVALKSIVKYFRENGVDVTKEWYHHELEGYQPWVMHFSLDEISRLRIPAKKACGGDSDWTVRIDPTKAGLSSRPEPGCRFPEAWGDSANIEQLAKKDNGTLAGLHDVFCPKTLLWYFFNRQHPVEHRVTPGLYTVRFDKGALSEVDLSTEELKVTMNGRLIRIGSDMCVPVLWRKDPELMAYSRNGCRRSWKLPGDWPLRTKVSVAEIGLEGLGATVLVPVKNRSITLRIRAGQALCVRPA